MRSVELPLAKPGENIFKVFVFDAVGGPVKLNAGQDRHLAHCRQIDAIPASHSIGVEAREKIGGRVILDYLVREGDQLPKKGKKTFKAEESLRASAAGSIKFKLWEGEIADPVSRQPVHRHVRDQGIGLLRRRDRQGRELFCEYEILDSGNIVLEVTVPSIGGSFPQRAELLFPAGRTDRLHQGSQAYRGGVRTRRQSTRRNCFEGR